LHRIPQAMVAQFLDYYASLNAADQSELLDNLALRAATMFLPSTGTVCPSPPAYKRFWDTIKSRGPFTGGYRYFDVKFLASVPKESYFGSYENWIENHQKPWVSELALTPRKDLLPDMTCLKPAKATLLRKLMSAAVKERGFAPVTFQGGQKFLNPAGDKILLDYGSQAGQICYHFHIVRGNARISCSFENLWSLHSGWDYLTEENAARSIDFFPELIEYMTGLAERLGGVMK
jgi:hypothetical protein